ncbi:hypothetical protein SteCoe_36931 [Stentor coeruleus]|uniref:Tyrosine-protein kinase ephrin type A/B receptor-like domain-containing protein n=1 Tax=Stentor coeruleus TaxID=5963 RepID=A0A1R2AP38_9CILI|nr:hypothetical protein SteCoe_36931 [Stentor coeruleus]
MLNNTYVTIAGHTRFQFTINKANVLMSNGTNYYIQDLYFPYVYYSAYAYYGNYIYSFGGGLSHGNIPVFLLASYNFYYIKMEDICSIAQCDPLCSIGTYKFNQTCIKCEPGSYSDIMGSEKCKLCPLGTYNPYEGASSYKQCLPCPEGTFNNKQGSSLCLKCSSNFNCPAGSKNPSNITFSSNYSSIQPKAYSSSSNNISLIYSLTISMASFLCLCLVLIISRLRNKLSIIDFYKDKHNHVLDKPMILKKNKFGGLFTIIFSTITIIFVGLSVIEYIFDNIQETKALVPLIVLNEDVNAFTANLLEISCLLVGYGGNCGENNVCDQGIFINAINLQGSSFNYTCSIDENESCVIKVMCYECEIQADASIFVNSKEELSYASEIHVNITSDSSIPNQISSIIQKFI